MIIIHFIIFFSVKYSQQFEIIIETSLLMNRDVEFFFEMMYARDRISHYLKAVRIISISTLECEKFLKKKIYCQYE